MPIPLITDYYSSFSTGSLFICLLNVKEGLTFLAEFDNEEALSEFSELCSKEDNVLIIHRSDDVIIINDSDESDTDDNDQDTQIQRKIILHYELKHIPIFSSREINSKSGNELLKHHLQAIMNFINFRAFDFDELQDHNTTTWFSYKEFQKIKTFEEFKDAFHKECKESQPNFTKLLPVKIIVRMRELMYRCYDWLLNGAHKKLEKKQSKRTLFTQIHDLVKGNQWVSHSARFMSEIPMQGNMHE